MARNTARSEEEPVVRSRGRGDCQRTVRERGWASKRVACGQLYAVYGCARGAGERARDATLGTVCMGSSHVFSNSARWYVLTVVSFILVQQPCPVILVHLESKRATETKCLVQYVWDSWTQCTDTREVRESERRTKRSVRYWPLSSPHCQVLTVSRGVGERARNRSVKYVWAVVQYAV
jgi:hypothetical protein